MHRQTLKEQIQLNKITKRINEKSNDISCLLYIDYNQGNDFIKELENVKMITHQYQKQRTPGS